MSTPYRRPANWSLLDKRLRAFGFVIAFRPHGKEPLWRDRSGTLWTEQQALEECGRREVEAEKG